jgi:PKD repeat protein
MRVASIVLGVLLLASAGCSDSPATQPSPIVPGSPQTPGAPTATFTLTVDGAGSQEAIAGVSNVTVDASASTGTGIRVDVAFGDGDMATTAVARHVYRAPGSFTITVTVTDDAGRKTTTTRQLVVASALGRWVHSGFIERRKEVEVRTLLLSAQDGLTVRGVLTRDGNRTIPVTGTLTAERTIRLVLEDGSEALEGPIPSVFSTLTTWPLTSRGGSIDGQPLAFTRIAGEVTGAAPDAVLGMRFFSFGAPFAVKQISPVLFDGSNSRGEGLTYYLEFGDGQSATTASATHPMQKEGGYVARLTVVDRFGRSDVETLAFEARTLVNPGGYDWWQGRVRSAGVTQAGVLIEFKTQEGTAVSGFVNRGNYPFEHSEFVGTVNPDGNVELRLVDSSVTLSGTMRLPTMSEYEHKLLLTYSGGKYDGQTMDLYWRRGY